MFITSFDSDSNFIKYEALSHEVQGDPENGKSRFQSWAIYPTTCTPNIAVLLPRSGTSGNSRAIQLVDKGKLALVGGGGRWGDPDLKCLSILVM